MVPPKFRGGSDDWMDEEDDSSGRTSENKKKKAPKSRAVLLPASESNGSVSGVYPNQCGVLLDDGKWALCNYRRNGVFRTDETIRERTPVAVGDRVKVEQVSGSDGIVAGVCERHNQLVRPAPDREQIHVIVANVDLMVIVTAAVSPDFSAGLVDRVLVAAGAAGIPSVLVVNKLDRLPEGAPKPWLMYRELGVEVFETTAKAGTGVTPLLERLQGKTVVFFGHSGVGKTSLINSLTGQEYGRVGEVSDTTGKGRHTTSGAVLLSGVQGSRWIDTPGVREFGLHGFTSQDLRRFFPEFTGAKCAVADCLHMDEEGCAVRELPRHDSYRRIYESLKELEAEAGG